MPANISNDDSLRQAIAKKISLVYLTRGNSNDSEFNPTGRRIGLKFDEKIYWVDKTFSRITDLDFILSSIGLHSLTYVDSTTRKTRVEQHFLSRTVPCGVAVSDKERLVSITYLNKPHSDIFNLESYLMAKSITNATPYSLAVNTLWWDINDLKKYFETSL